MQTTLNEFSDSFFCENFADLGDVFLIPVMSNYLVYAPMQGFVALLALEDVRALKDEFSGVSSEPLRAFLKKSGVVSADIPRDNQNGDSSWAPTSVTFSNTQKCTLRCTYCYADGGRLDDAVISKPIVDAAVDLIIANAIEKGVEPSVNFLGEGEATADWSTFDYIISSFREKCRAKNVSSFVEVSTNGVFPIKRVAYLVENVDQITFSLDGIEFSHDQHRVLPNGKGSFGKVVETMKEFDRLKKDYSIRSTATLDAVHFLPDFVEFVGCNLATKNIHVEPAFDMSNVALTAKSIDVPPSQLFVEQYRKARQVAAEYDIVLYFSGADLATRDAFCGVSNARNMIVTAKGTVTSCNEVLRKEDRRASTFQYGSWDLGKKKFVFDGQRIAELKKVSVNNIPKCQGCFAKYNCAGDCYAKTMASHGDVFTDSYTERCAVTRELLKDNLLIKLLSDMPELARSEARAESIKTDPAAQSKSIPL